MCKLWEETAECKGGFRNGEGASHLVEECEVFVGVDGLLCAEVTALAADVRLSAGLDVYLQRVLSVEFDGEVHYIASCIDAERRGVGPSSGNVDAYSRSSPYNLIGIDIEMRLLQVVVC